MFVNVNFPGRVLLYRWHEWGKLIWTLDWKQYRSHCYLSRVNVHFVCVINLLKANIKHRSLDSTMIAYRWSLIMTTWNVLNEWLKILLFSAEVDEAINFISCRKSAIFHILFERKFYPTDFYDILFSLNSVC